MEPPLLLHGTLYVTVIGIEKPYTGCGFRSCQQWGEKFLGRVKEMVRHEIDGPKLFATVDLDEVTIARTSDTTDQTSNPRWNQSFCIHSAHVASKLVFTVKNHKEKVIGRASVPANDVLDEFKEKKERKFDILDKKHRPVRGGSQIHVELKFESAAYASNWSRGIDRSDYEGIPYLQFDQKPGCKVTLYQDAHVIDEFKPIIPLSETKNYEIKRCWEDIYYAIWNARHFVYITGWSVNTRITLMSGQTQLGELLKNKADEGVAVLILIWDGRKDGLMGTHNQETADYFRDTKVQCVVCPRNPEDNAAIIKGYHVSQMFTHHQKAVVVDGECNSNVVPGGQSQNRRVVSFVGGIDLCHGRYDTQEHPLFKTLGTLHRDDFHQPNFPDSSIKKGGPREPWHDIHCKLEGPVALDVMKIFEQRWKMQADEKLLVPPAKIDKFLIHPKDDENLKDNESWNVQIFRSTDGTAAAGIVEATKGHISSKNIVVDQSIQDAYISAIRRAKNFIYIEYQYFLGSSYSWLSKKGFKVKDINDLHLIPKELALKIDSKIKAGERFTVYIVIPMWPEGDPESDFVQAILDWQRRTMEMMYADIAKAIKKKRLDAHPRDYLTFFCLGNREMKRPEEYTPPEKPEPNSSYYKAQQARRFKINVNSKMMIVDDEYIIVGSANINQRSKDGAMDTEIAVGAFQPQHLALTDKPARGQIYGFRMALWYEHLRRLHTSFDNPESKECVQLVNDIADQNWETYTKFEVNDLPGHLLRYPIEVKKDGAVEILKGFESFPDLGSTNASFIMTYLYPNCIRSPMYLLEIEGDNRQD